MKLGARLESIGLPFRAALAAAGKAGAAGVQMDAVGDLHPDRLSQSGRREVTHILRSHGLELTALGCPLRHGLDHPLNLDPRIDHIRKVLTLSFELGARRVIVEAGRVPEKPDDPRALTMRESLTALGTYADRVGATLALESGLESGEALAAYLGTFATGGLGVNYDPGNMLLHGYDPVANLAPVKGLIVHTHAHDARMGGASRSAQSVPLGGGDIDWMAYLGTLAATEYAGWVVVETDDPDAAAVEQGIRFLRRLI
jgi:L-ribulose-5-phosphate 3-epimerase